MATAPRAEDGHVNCSPKGGDTFRVLDENTVAYLDLTGSGIKTVAHVQENGRIVIMFCAFKGAPRIVRLHGRAQVIYPKHSGFDFLATQFPTEAGTRSMIKVTVTRISDSCGYVVPLMNFVKDRDVLEKWTEKKTPEELADYRARKNRVSIDAIPGYLNETT